MKLNEYKTKNYHFFTDEQGRYQGEFFAFHDNGKIKRQGNYKDDVRHGKYTCFKPDGSIAIITYFDMEKDITKKYLKNELLDAILEL
jgi:antitoxin component YwqK of YwqJK toxin-antitoxin module